MRLSKVTPSFENWEIVSGELNWQIMSEKLNWQIVSAELKLFGADVHWTMASGKSDVTIDNLYHLDKSTRINY